MEPKEKIAVSACLLGYECRYDSKSNKNEKILLLDKEYELCPICPEIYGGLPTPRVPSERFMNKVVNKNGFDVTNNFIIGAELSYKVIEEKGIKIAILKSKSPSCGKGLIYDGSFSSNLITGNGVTTDYLISKGIKVYSENDYEFWRKKC